MRFRPDLQAVARGHMVQAEPIGVGQRVLPNWRNTRLVDDDTERQGHRLPCTADLNGVRPLAGLGAAAEAAKRDIGRSPEMARMRDRLEAGVREQVKVIIGGAPVTQDYADQIGADGFSPDAGSATRITKKLMGIS